MTCAFEIAASGAKLCAIDPTKTTPGVTDTFGFHAVGFPATVTADTPVYVHFVGTGGDPAKPATQTFPNQLLMEELTALGALVLLPAYDNEPSVGALCKQDLDCYEPVRDEILFGDDAPAPYTSMKDVKKPNDALSRIAALVDALHRSGMLGATPPAALAGGKLDWSKARVGGHSQGGGHAGLIAKRFAVERVCFLSSPIDGAPDGAGGGLPVPWTAGVWATDVSRRRAAVHEDDPGFAKAAANLAAMTMVEDTHWRRLRFATADPHASTVKDPAAAPVRRACVL